MPTVNDSLREIAQTAAGAIPYVGPVISKVISLFWPISATDIWEMIKEKVEKYVQEEIFNLKMEQLKQKMMGLKINFQELKNLKGEDLRIKLIALDTDIKCDLPFFIYDEPSHEGKRKIEVANTLPLFPPMAVLHLTVLSLIVNTTQDIKNRDTWKQNYELFRDKYVSYAEDALVHAIKEHLNQKGLVTGMALVAKRLNKPGNQIPGTGVSFPREPIDGRTSPEYLQTIEKEIQEKYEFWKPQIDVLAPFAPSGRIELRRSACTEWLVEEEGFKAMAEAWRKGIEEYYLKKYANQ